MIYDDLRVADLSTGLAGGYCSKLLTDLGADVLKVEPPGGDPLRDHDALFQYLHTSQRSVVAEAGELPEWVIAADVMIESFTPGVAESLGLVKLAPVTVSISSFGRGGPDSTLDLSEPVLQARSGSLSNHGHIDRPPLTVGGRLGDFVTGAFAALGAVTAWRRVQRTGQSEHVDVSMLEAMQLTMATVPTLMARFPGGFLGTFRWVMIPGNEPTKDGGYVGITTVTKQQWLSLLSLMGRDDLAADDELATMMGRGKRSKETNELIRSWTMQHTAPEIVELCAAARVPAAVVGNGALLPQFDQMVERQVFVEQPGAGFVRPRAPFHFSAVADRVMTPAPTLGERAPAIGAASVRGQGVPGRSERDQKRGAASVRGQGVPGRSERDQKQRPFAGIKVLDFTAFWSGPFATAWLCAMGAEVIKVESMQRPDGIRFSAAVRPHKDPQFYEKSALFHAANLGKKGITLDLGHPDGLAIAKRLVERCDVVAENFTPRVMDGFGLSYDDVAGIRPDVIMLRLPAFGLSGPWRDRPGFAQTMEQLTGMAWVTGYDGGPPIIPGGVVDPMVGTHAAIALVAALEHRDRTGEGQLVEMAMIEVSASMTAEQVIEFSASGTLLGRRGEGGVYACEGEEQWVAIDVEHDLLAGEVRAEWCASRRLDDVVAELTEAGIPAAAMVPAYATLDDPQLRARGFFSPIEHPLVGEQEYPGFPMRFWSEGPEGGWWSGRPAPLLGQHTEEVLRAELGLTDVELAHLRAEQVIGERPVGA